MRQTPTELSIRKRIEYIDILRGVCMILIVWYHTDHPEILNYPFYNNTLFFVSGMLFKPCEWRLFVIKKIRRFIIPFFFFYTIYYFFLITSNYLKFHNVSSDIYLSIFDVFRWYKDNNAYTCNYPLWFIWALLWVQVQTNCLMRIVKNTIFLFFISLIISIIGYIYIQHIPTPFILGRSTTFLAYYTSGYVLFKYLTQSDKIRTTLVLAIIIWGVSFLFCGFLKYTCIIILMSIIQNIAFAIVLLELSKIFQHTFLKEALTFFGINSIIVFGMHDMYLSILRILTNGLFGEMNLFLGCINWITTLLLMIPTIFFFNLYFPKLIGRSTIIVKR